jgi:hypothetical protein
VPENRAMKFAIFDDYQNVALKMADWTVLAVRAEITVFNDHLADVEELVERLAPFDSAGWSWELLTSRQKGSRFNGGSQRNDVVRHLPQHSVPRVLSSSGFSSAGFRGSWHTLAWMKTCTDTGIYSCILCAMFSKGVNHSNTTSHRPTQTKYLHCDTRVRTEWSFA